jgi:hypothetical protein
LARLFAQVVDNTVKKSQIGRSNNRMSLNNQANLKRIMEEARRQSLKNPTPQLSPIRLPEPQNPTNLLRVLKNGDSFDLPFKDNSLVTDFGHGRSWTNDNLKVT